MPIERIPEVLALVADPDGDGLIFVNDCPADYYGSIVFGYPIEMDFPVAFHTCQKQEYLSCPVRRADDGLVVQMPDGTEVAFDGRKEDRAAYTGSDPFLSGLTIQPIAADAEVLEVLCQTEDVFFVGVQELKPAQAVSITQEKVKP